MADDALPEWLLNDPQPHNLKDRGPVVSLPIAKGMPTAMLSASHAMSLGRQLLEAAQVARRLPVTD